MLKHAIILGGMLACAAAAQIKKVLVTNYIFGSAHNTGRPKNAELVGLLATEMGFTVEAAATEGRITADFVKGFDLVVWNNMSQNGLQNATTKTVWQNYIEGGGAVLALHAAGDTRNGTWTWFMEGVLDAQYQIHSAVEAADVWIHPDAIAPSGQFHPILKGQQTHFKEYTININGTPTKKFANVWTDEWYVFPRDPKPGTANLTVLLELDEFNLRKVTNWNPNETKTGYHPMSWARSDIGAGKGRVVFLVTGHDDKIHQARATGLKDLWKNSMLWATKNSAGCMTPTASNYNPWVDKDDGSCTGVSTAPRPDASEWIKAGAGLSSLSIARPGSFRVTLSDASGRKVYGRTLAGPGRFALKPGLPKGAYFLSVKEGGKTVVSGMRLEKD